MRNSIDIHGITAGTNANLDAQTLQLLAEQLRWELKNNFLNKAITDLTGKTLANQHGEWGVTTVETTDTQHFILHQIWTPEGDKVQNGITVHLTKTK